MSHSARGNASFDAFVFPNCVTPASHEHFQSRLRPIDIEKFSIAIGSFAAQAGGRESIAMENFDPNDRDLKFPCDTGSNTFYAVSRRFSAIDEEKREL